MVREVVEVLVADVFSEVLRGMFAPAPTAGRRWLRRLAWTGAAGVAAGLTLAAADGTEAAGLIVAGVGLVLWAVCGFAASVVRYAAE